MSGGQCALRLIPSSSTPSSCFLVSYLVTRACGFVASSVWEFAVGLSVVLVYDVSPCVSGCNSLEARLRLLGSWP